MSEHKFNVMQPGMQVTIGSDDNSLYGRILQTGITISHDGTSIRYRVAWWDGTTRYDEWLEEWEVEEWDDDSLTETVVVGFKQRSVE